VTLRYSICYPTPFTPYYSTILNTTIKTKSLTSLGKNHTRIVPTYVTPTFTDLEKGSGYGGKSHNNIYNSHTISPSSP